MIISEQDYNGTVWVQKITTLTRMACQQDCTRSDAVGGCEYACGAETFLAVEPATQHDTQLWVSIDPPTSQLLQVHAALTYL